MRGKFLLLFSFSLFFLRSLPPLHAQVHQAAVGNERHLSAGVEYSNFVPDYNFFNLDGVSIFADYSITHRFSADGEIRLLDLNKPAGETEKTFMAGPLVKLYWYHHLTVFAKVVAGAATVNYPDGIGYGSYFSYAPEGGVDYYLGHRFTARGEYEFDFLPSAPGFPGQPSNGLTPHGFSIGASYRIF